MTTALARPARRRGSIRFATDAIRAITLLAVLLFAAVAAPPGGHAQPRPQPAAAATTEARKVVGLVFDDSGSMKNRIQLPAFAAQLLVSSLDPSRDRLFTIRLSTWVAAAKEGEVARTLAQGGGVNPQSMARLRVKALPDLPRDEFAGASSPEAILGTIRTQWPVARSDTPYGPLEMMLETLTAEARAGDVVHLVVLTDGKFEPAPPDPATLRRNFEQYRSRIKAPLHVDFVLIAPADAEGDGVRLAVEQQGVRRTLAAVFEGGPDRNCGPNTACNDVSNSRDLYRVMFDVVARINETDRSGGRSGSAARVDDRRVTLESPLSVSRIVGMTFAPAGEEPPKLAGTTFGAAPTLALDSWMEAGDTAAGWRDERNKARAVQFNLRTALGPGTHALEFDRPLGDRHLFLFDTAARFRLEARDAQGRPLPTGRDGVAEVVQGQPIRIVGSVTDRIGGRDVDVDWERLTQATVEAFVDTPNGRAAVPVDPTLVDGHRQGTFTPTVVGSHAVGGSLTLDGFVRKEAQRPAFRVVDGKLAPTVAIRAVDCPECGANELRTRLLPDRPTATVGEVDVTLPKDRAVPFTASLAGSPPWMSLVDRDGAAVSPDRVLRPDDGGRATLRLVRTIETPDEPRTHDRPIVVRIQPAAPWSGSVEATATLRVEVPEPRLEHVGDTAGGGPGATLSLDGADLDARRHGLRFELKGVSGLPVRLEDFSVATRSTWVAYEIAQDGAEIVVRPVDRWCVCAAWLFGIPGEVELVHRGIGEARATGPMAFAPTGRELLRSCGPCVGWVLLVVWFAVAVVAYARAPRFPKRAFADIKRRNQPIRASEPLRRWDGEGNWRCIRGAVCWRPTPARHSVEGLHLEAAYGGFRVLFDGSNDAIKVEAQGRTLRTIREEGTRRDFLALPWNSAFGEPRSFEQLVVRSG